MQELEKVAELLQSLGDDATRAFVWYLIVSVVRTTIPAVVVTLLIVLAYKLIKFGIGSAALGHQVAEITSEITGKDVRNYERSIKRKEVMDLVSDALNEKWGRSGS